MCNTYYMVYQERMNPTEGGEGAYNCYIKHCVNLCQMNLHKMPIYRQTLSKQGGGAKWLTIHNIKNLQTNRAQ